jgi:ABC-type antimicrobial peptide transport system permease subunit
MFRQNLLFIYRNFKKFKSTFFINLIGLSSGLACTLFIFLWVSDELNVDKFNEKDSQIFQAMENRKIDSGIGTGAESSGPLAEALLKEMPEIEYAAAVAPPGWFGKSTLSINDNDIKAVGQYAGKDYFNIFSYDLIQGDKDKVLTEKKSIVISDELALKLFDTTENIIGKTIDFQHKKQFVVSGIFKKIPSNSSNQFDFVLTWEEMEDSSPWVREWGNTGPHTYVMVKQGTSINQLNGKIANLIKIKTQDSSRNLFLKRYSQNYLYGNYENGVQAGGRIEYVRLFSIIAFFILLIACINFMNLSTAKASRRMKEVGMRKALGATRKSLIFQYMGESLLMTLLSLLLAILIVIVFLPYFNQITGKQIALFFNAKLLISLLVITVFTGLIAGSYPALYLSRFNPVKVLKGTFQSSLSELLARKGLVIFQFTLSVILILSVIVVYKQIEFVQTKNIGFDKDHIVSFEIEGAVAKSPAVFLLELKNIPGIINASSTAHRMVGHNFATAGLEWEGKNPNELVYFECIKANYDLIETLDIQMKVGRSFSRNFGADSSKIILNETAIETMALKDPIGKKIRLWDQDREIIGVTKNFHFESLHEKVKPLFFCLLPFETKYVMAKIQAGKERETVARLEKFYKKYNPGFTLDYKFLDSDYQAQYVAEKRVSVLSRYFAGIAILISCLGLFGLAAFTAEKRRREIGVRKVLGATIAQIVLLLSRDFMRLVFIAIVIAFPIAFWATQRWMQGFAYKTTLGWWLFVLPGILAILIALLTVSYQAIKAAIANPVKSLRTE